MAYMNSDLDSRDEYLADLALQFDLDVETVRIFADFLGPDEDFDGLINQLEEIDDPFL